MCILDARMFSYSAHAPSQGKGMMLSTAIPVPVDKKPKQVFKIPVLVDKEPEWKSKSSSGENKLILYFDRKKNKMGGVSIFFIKYGLIIE